MTSNQYSASREGFRATNPRVQIHEPKNRTWAKVTEDRSDLDDLDDLGPRTSDLPELTNTMNSTKQHELALLDLDGRNQVHHRLHGHDGIVFLVIVHRHHELESAKLVGASCKIPL